MLLARRLAAARSVKAAAGVPSRGPPGAGGGTVAALRDGSGTRGSGVMGGMVGAVRAGGSEGTGSGATAVARSSILDSSLGDSTLEGSTLGSSGTGGVDRDGSVVMRPPRLPRGSPSPFRKSRPLRESPRTASDDDGNAFGSISGAGEATDALGVRAGTAEPTRYGRPKKISKNVGAEGAVAMANPRNGRVL